MTRILGDTFYEIVAEAFKIMAQRIAAAVGDDLNPTVARYMAMARRMEEKDNETR